MIRPLSWLAVTLFLTACGSDTETHGTTASQGSTGEAPCSTVDECPGSDDVCQKRTCIAAKCGMDFTPDGTAIPTDSVGDCKRRVCDGAGTTKELPDDSDTKPDGKECTVDACTAGMPTNVAKPVGTTCTEDGGRFCHDDGECRYCPTPGASCDDTDEPNDTEATASDLGTLKASDAAGQKICGVLKGAADVDWYTFSGTDDGPTNPGRTLASDTAVRVCKYVECAEMTTAVKCPTGTTDDTSPAGRAGCCGTKPFELDAAADLCPDGANDATVWIKIENQAKAACAPYQLDVHF